MDDDKPLRVVVVGLHYAPEHSGNAPYTTGLARHLASAAMKVLVLTGYPHYPEWRVHRGYEGRRANDVHDGVQLRRLRHPVPATPTGPARVGMEAVFALKVAGQLLRHRADVVVAVSPVLLSLVPAVLLRTVRAFRLGVVVQDLYGAALAETGMANGRLARATAWLEARLLRRADSVVVIHDVMRARVQRAGVPDERITVIPNWSHVTMPTQTDRARIRAQLGWGDQEIIALHAGNMGVKQGLEGLIDTAKIASERKSVVRIVLVGDGSRRQKLAAYGAGLSNLTFMDPLPSGLFEEALTAADVLLLHEKPGVIEMSVPSKLTSYFSAGRPVVAATASGSGAAALILASGAGEVVPAADVHAILEAIERLAADPERMDALGARGAAFAASHMGAGASLSRYEAWVRALGTDESPEQGGGRTGHHRARDMRIEDQ